LTAIHTLTVTTEKIGHAWNKIIYNLTLTTPQVRGLIENEMALFSFIDNEKKDFLRYDDGGVVIISSATWEGAESWLLSKGRAHGWTNTGVNYFNWTDQFPD